MSTALFVIPRPHDDGFTASIRGHMLDLVEPSSRNGLAPTPDDLFVVSHASELAWCTRTFLRSQGLPDNVSVSAAWHTPQGLPGTSRLELTITVSGRAEGRGAALRALLERSSAARSVAEQVVQVAFDRETDQADRR
jgi:hypothetical protein